MNKGFIAFTASQHQTRRKRVMLLSVVAISFTLSGCDNVSKQFWSAVDGSPDPAREIFDYNKEVTVDDFTSITTTKSAASAVFGKNKLDVYVTATCVKKSNVPEKSSPMITFKSVMKGSERRTDSINAILYNVDDRGVQRYGNYDSFNYGNIPVNVDLDQISNSESAKLPEFVKFRLIRSGSVLELMDSNIDRLSELPKIDLKIPIRTSNVGKVITDCRAIG